MPVHGEVVARLLTKMKELTNQLENGVIGLEVYSFKVREALKEAGW
jgi:hypothetical protein